MDARHRRVCDIFLPQCKMNLEAAHIQQPSCPGRTTSPLWADDARQCAGGHAEARNNTAAIWTTVLRACLRDLAAEFARALLSASPSSKTEGAGKAGRRLAPEGPHATRTHAGLTTGDAGRPAFPAQWCYGLWRALPGERCTIAPVALRLIDARARSGRFITASLDARTSGVRTTRFCRPRTFLAGHSKACACSLSRPQENAVTTPCRSRGSRWLTVTRPAIYVTRRRYRVHRTPAYAS